MSTSPVHHRRPRPPEPPSPVDGVLLVDKAQGMTSHDVVAITRKRIGTKKVGHCGTLDPLATGLLIVVIGKATKIQDLLMSEDKEYEGALLLGVTTDSQDSDGQTLETREVPPLTEADIRRAFDQFTGDLQQIPPMVSAIKQGGVPLYKLARQGQTVEREPRLVHVFSYEILRCEPPVVEFRVRCSKGFYVRTYAHDIGQTLGCGAHMIALRRTRSGNFHVSTGITLDELKNGPAENILAKCLTLPQVSRLRGA